MPVSKSTTSVPVSTSNQRETVDQRFGRQKVLLQQFCHRLLRLVGAIDLMRFLGDARAVIDDDELESAKLERSDPGMASVHVGLFRLFLSHRNARHQRWRSQHPSVPAPIKVRRFIDISLMVHPTSLPC